MLKKSFLLAAVLLVSAASAHEAKAGPVQLPPVMCPDGSWGNPYATNPCPPTHDQNPNVVTKMLRALHIL